MLAQTLRLRTLAAVAFAICSATAAAQTFDVKQPEVTKGAMEYGPESMFAWNPPHDANRHANEQALFYGLTEWWKISGALKIERPVDDDLRLGAVSLANIFVFKALDEKRTHDVGLGWFTEVSASTHHDTTNSVLFGFIPTFKAGKLSATANPFFEQTFGRNRDEGIALSYGWQVKYDLREGLGIGLEGFGVVENLGDPPPLSEQEHRVGPVLYTEFELTNDRKINVDLGLLFGLTAATADVALKLNFGVPLYAPIGKAKE